MEFFKTYFRKIADFEREDEAAAQEQREYERALIKKLNETREKGIGIHFEAVGNLLRKAMNGYGSYKDR